jgi:imidazole glycerol-phosphate synthase subunit HisF
MLLRRVIVCLDVAGGRVVKGTHFVDLRDQGDPAELAARYAAEGADEIVLLDIGAAPEGRATRLELVRRTARGVDVPLTVGGGVRSMDEMRAVLRAGADKVAVNSAAVRDPALISRCARRFGRQCVVVAIDARRTEVAERVDGSARSPFWEVVVAGGRTATGIDALDWAARAADLGAGELLVTSIDRDGTRRGYDLDLLRSTAAVADVPLVASGGAGSAADMVAAIRHGQADAVLAAGIFHEGKTSIVEVKSAMGRAGLPVRMAPAA